MMKFGSEKEENIFYQHFLLFSHCFTKRLSQGHCKVSCYKWSTIICRRHNFRLVQIEQIADDNLKCIKNEKDEPYRIENIVRKGEIACYKQFLLFSQCFPQLYIFSASKCAIVLEWVK